ncbi:phosphoadenylyl-sulfate reductase [Sphingobacterium thalpophilum]|uniref:Adenosine 5'-phosphosulfate reductase n=1 Tax=Sphingobacterium thalpophilum TaxID=259 RepID=A0A4U9W1R8_9SPHI|nr:MULTISPECIES: phosphoadenylyl-sulfate reductase [Sphingobacterium]MCW8311956.1 phosphoadenylyl-sulfate reductase [Sphingobacterium sp. InxBP1]VTR51924.1 Phosphoadenosine phosphosulfate reductase [Sphingobacterium thalpophilum]
MNVEEIKEILGDKKDVALLQTIAALYPSEVVFSTSFGIEDQIITEWIGKNNIDIEIFTLDTGRLFKETYSLWSRTLERYQLPIRTYTPDTALLEEFISRKGPNSFYESVENRKECCRIRKIEPLQRAIKGKKIWVTGIRAEQSANRHDMDFVEYDEINEIIKIHPLFDWTFEEVKQYCREQHIPYNVLHDKGFPSIGCQPCTRAVQEGEDFRAGRWWWEDQSKKECGLHAVKSHE